MVNITWGTTKKPVASQRLADYFESNKLFYSGDLYIGYPIIAAPEGAYPIDAIWVSPEKGVVIFCLVEGRELEGYPDTQDESANRLETKLRGHMALMRGRTLLATPSPITFAPAANIENEEIEGYPLCNLDNLHEAIDDIEWKHSEKFELVLSVLQSISTIRKGKRTRKTTDPESKGSKLKTLEDSIAHLDNIQGKAVIETVEGVQRIRGLAGSGKTIVLALKAAYLHTQHPDWRIAVTFNTRSLKEQFRRLINTFVIEQSGEEPDWSNISILNAWGAPGGINRSGLYYQFVKNHNIAFRDFQSAKNKYGFNEAFTGACREALSELKKEIHIFDAILIDEAQDFSLEFFQLCYSMLSAPKRLVYAYDELQSLTESSLPGPEELFGKKSDGSPTVRFSEAEPNQPQQDIILEKCYRNSRPVLATAHALGFGIYRDPDPKTGTGLIQMFDQPKLWLDVGYRVNSGTLEDDAEVSLSRTSETSPVFLENHSNVSELIEFHNFESKEKQAEWLAEEIEKNLKDDELDPDDIIVINPDPLSTRKEVGLARKFLFEKGIESHLAGVDLSPDVFFDARNNSVAFTGIFRAKGNEAGMVYIINADNCYSSFGNISRVRNQLFTAITRSKSWVRVVGVGGKMQQLSEEYTRVQDANFELHFRYPSAEIREKLKIINRDMTEAEKIATRSSRENAEKLADDIEAGRVLIEDLPEEVIDRLKSVLIGRNQS